MASLSLGSVEAFALTLTEALGVSIRRTVTVDLLVRATHVVVEATLATLLSGSLGCEATGAFITGARSGATDSIASSNSGPCSDNWSNSTDSGSNATDSRYYATDSGSYATDSRSNSDSVTYWSDWSSNNALAESGVNNAASYRTHRAAGSSDNADTGADPSTSSETGSNTAAVARASKTDARTDTCTIPSSVATTVATTVAASVSSVTVAATIISAETRAIASSAKSCAESGSVGRAWAGRAAAEASAEPATAQEQSATLDFFVAILLVTGIARRGCYCGRLACFVFGWLIFGWLIFSQHCEAQC